MKVLVTSAAFGQPAMQENIKYLNSVADTVVMKPSQKPLTAKEIATCWDGVDGIIGRNGTVYKRNTSSGSGKSESDFTIWSWI